MIHDIAVRRVRRLVSRSGRGRGITVRSGVASNRRALVKVTTRRGRRASSIVSRSRRRSGSGSGSSSKED